MAVQPPEENKRPQASDPADPATAVTPERQDQGAPRRRRRRRPPCRDRRRFNRRPKEHQFPPGQSGNPKGAKPRAPATTDFDACLDRSLNQRLKVLGKDGRTRITTPMTVGSDLIAMRYAKGDHHAQRIVAGRSGQRRPMSPRRVDQSDTQEPLPLEYEAILKHFFQREYNEVVRPEPVIAPPQLLDDDAEEHEPK